MGIEENRPTEEVTPNNKHFEAQISKEEIDDTVALKDLVHPTLGYIATFGWIGIDEISGDKLRQPAIWFDGSTANTNDYYISYEGVANYMDYQITQAHLVVPRNGTVLKMKDNVRYFFNNHDSVSPNKNYALQHNNTSIIMNNVSIYNTSHLKGIMINLRASFDGLIDDDVIGGNVNILCTVDSIG